MHGLKRPFTSIDDHHILTNAPPVSDGLTTAQQLMMMPQMKRLCTQPQQTSAGLSLPLQPQLPAMMSTLTNQQQGAFAVNNAQQFLHHAQQSHFVAPSLVGCVCTY
jgi:hypothetical protein